NDTARYGISFVVGIARLAVVGILLNGINQRFGGRVSANGCRAVRLKSTVQRFPVSPTVVPAFRNHTDFLPRVLTHVAAIKKVSHGIEREPPRVPKSHRVEFGADVIGIHRRPIETGPADEWIVRGNSVIPETGDVGVR